MNIYDTNFEKYDNQDWNNLHNRDSIPNSIHYWYGAAIACNESNNFEDRLFIENSVKRWFIQEWQIRTDSL